MAIALYFGRRKIGDSNKNKRSSQQVVTTLRATSVELKGRKQEPGIEVQLVYVTSDDSDLEWLLLTNEPIGNLSEVGRVVAHYEKRWLIEQFHKSWKTGCKIEERKMGSLANYLRMMAITMPAALGLLQLQVLANLTKKNMTPATEVLSPTEVTVLWNKIERSPLPKERPSCQWAYRAIAKLAGWQDSKRIGRIGLDTIWRGIERLTMLVDGWLLAMELSN